MNDRIGRIEADGARVWPERTVSGHAYERPAHTLDISPEAFIVYDVFAPANLADLIAEARAFIAPKSKRMPHDRTDDAG